MIGVWADLHDHDVNFANFLEKTKELNLSELWIAGDLGTPDMLREICQKFSGSIAIVAGNVETGHDVAKYAALAKQFPKLIWSPQAPLVLTRGTTHIALFHYPGPAERYTKTQNVNLVISGHTHRPAINRVGETWHINPGTLAGIFTPATYVLADIEHMTFTLKRLYE
jgi:putative phosphoesterase